MSFFTNIKHQHSLKVFRNRARKVSFPHQEVSFDKAKCLGFIINTSQISKEDLHFFTKHISRLKEEGKRIVLVEINFQRKSDPLFTEGKNTVFLNPSSINWLQFPAISALKKINSAEIDILFNLDTSENMTSPFICGLSNAKMRVGAHEENTEGFYELMVQLSENSTLREFLQTSENFTKMLVK